MMLKVYYYILGQCGEQVLHPYSEMLLMAFLNGKVEQMHFLKWFHMPNSDYLELGRCVLEASRQVALPMLG